ncbi:MAG TPA: hypothetical protein PKK06_15685 [Phycisphaerae bacterium]|nr:hypothetical protein [Phycisphaerae bacterium]HNU46759.1 hypothetical protein [Phycisphaerae bacterium]
MNRREFVSVAGATLLGTALRPGQLLGQPPPPAGGTGPVWHRNDRSQLFDQVTAQGRALLMPQEGVGLLDGFCCLIEEGKPGAEIGLGGDTPNRACGPVQVALAHQLRRSAGDAKEDLLEATLTLKNSADKPCEVFCGFLTGVRPCADPAAQQVYVPLSAAGLADLEGDPRRRLKDCHQSVGAEGFLCHYLEVPASDPRNATTRATLLAPVVDVFADAGPCHVALFGTSTEPVFFEALQGVSGRAWRVGKRVSLTAGQMQAVKVFLLLHAGDAAEAWDVFRRFGHREDFPVPEWTRRFRVHYFDFLSGVEADGPRGNGYEADTQHFREFHVGMATQHGYYFALGDYLHPERKEWQAMPTDAKGPAAMSLEKMKARLAATRQAGAHPMIYLHFTLFDDGTPLYEKMKDFIQVDAAGNPIPFGWEGPDVIKKTWKMSVASPEWRSHLVKQAQWVMELLDPDGIVLDETFTACGYDHHPNRRGPLSPGGIDLMRRLRAAVRSFGPDKALFASDCSMGSFCLWGDGEAGDHCYDRLVGQPLYRKPPVRYLAALGTKAWQPCAWMYKTLWAQQMDLARTVGAGVGVTNGWGDNFGLTRLPADVKQQMLRDIESLTIEGT